MNKQPQEIKGYVLGLMGVTIFAATLPITKIAVGSADAPLMSGQFVTLARAAIAALLSALWLLWVRPPLPRAREWLWLAITAGGVVIGFPLFMGLAMRHVDGIHASVVLGALPLVTAVFSALLHGQRAPAKFWCAALLGTALVMLFAMWQTPNAHTTAWGSFAVSSADLLLLAAVVCASMGYTTGAQLARTHRSETVISWALVIASPITLPGMWLTWPTDTMPTASWLALGYVALFSMWIGFFAWYRGLALGGVMRVSQVQLLQPFLGILFSIPLLGEQWSWTAAVFAAAVVACVMVGRRALRNAQ
ncbi:DMT family transporter [Comamonadaceae bacterium M7527]|nr:DMT family transporter [Comamonadaceae bacterium M7527]